MVVATFWVLYKGRLVVTLQFWSGNQDHWHPGSIRWSTSTTIKPRSQPRQNLAVKIKTMIKTDRRSQAVVTTSTTMDQGVKPLSIRRPRQSKGIEAAVTTSTATNQGVKPRSRDQYGLESSYQGQDDDQDKSGHQDQDGSSSGVGVRDVSSSPHAFVRCGTVSGSDGSKTSQDSRSQQEQIRFKPTMKSKGMRVRIEVNSRDAQSCNKFKMMKALQVTSWRVQVGL
ncbi:hypothetical protein B0F90DRAFT_1920025 [Multifurca ochricompacta]|uniref:Uncharacterized protein n=1 Tax=Multifurca ochricompacta TaxID=376703 RepID=A0AAD4LYI2_9AGAM|nr:hypothetical protein B0F90DRAFT_1920025 [Multifurca ochricompacta]